MYYLLAGSILCAVKALVNALLRRCSRAVNALLRLYSWSRASHARPWAPLLLLAKSSTTKRHVSYLHFFGQVFLFFNGCFAWHRWAVLSNRCRLQQKRKKQTRNSLSWMLTGCLLYNERGVWGCTPHIPRTNKNTYPHILHMRVCFTCVGHQLKRAWRPHTVVA